MTLPLSFPLPTLRLHHPAPAETAPARPAAGPAAPRARPAGLMPVFVDLDGTLVATDTMLECFLLLLRHRPLALLRIPGWLARGRAHFKARLAECNRLDIARLPYRPEVCDYLRAAHAAGQPLYLATAADRRIARRVAAHLGLFTGVLASDGATNLKSARKLDAIRALAPDGFAYLGNSRADLPLWRAAASAIVVAAPPAVLRAARAGGRIERVLAPPRAPWREACRALRPHQWAKNLLVFVPLLTSFRFGEAAAAAHAALAFVAFSLCASAVYVLNDLLDIDADRAHPRKRGRPFAAGTLSIPAGLGAAGLCLAAGFGTGALLSPEFLAVLAVYLATATAYSVHLKTRVFLDVIVLASLYTLRLVAGGVGTGIPLSVWLVAFSLFVFLSLGLVKRCSELLTVKRQGRLSIHGRDYALDDMRIFFPLGISTAVGSVLVFALYINATQTAANYRTPALLWGVAVGLFYWLGHMWIITARGAMTDDPLVFTFRDGDSRLVIALMVLCTLAAHFLP